MVGTRSTFQRSAAAANTATTTTTTTTTTTVTAIATTARHKKKEAVASTGLLTILHPAHPHTINDSNSSNSNSHRNLVVRWEDDTATTTTTTQKKKPAPVVKEVLPVFLEAAEFKSVLQDDAAIKEVFVEMCFYARLGFVQPPCCLRCTYQTKPWWTQIGPSSNAAAPCARWLAWRKHADRPLHPDTLGDDTTGIVLVRCHAARRLLQGQPVAGRIWNGNAKRLQLVTL